MFKSTEHKFKSTEHKFKGTEHKFKSAEYNFLRERTNQKKGEKQLLHSNCRFSPFNFYKIKSWSNTTPSSKALTLMVCFFALLIGNVIFLMA